MSESIDDIKARVLAEKRAKVAEERKTDGVPEKDGDKVPIEWVADVQRSADALKAVMGGKIVGGSFDPISGSFTGFEVDVNGEHISITFSPTDDGQSIRFLPAIFDSKPMPLPPNLQALQDRAKTQPPGIAFPGRPRLT